MILEAIWIFLPAGIANMVPVFCARLPILNRWNAPIDGGKTYKGVRMLGQNKTWRGLLCGTVTAAVFALLQYRVITPTDDSTAYILTLGALLGFGALLGDAVASFAKRQRGIQPGQAWIPFDQTDYIFGGIIIALPLLLHQINLISIFIIVVTYSLLHVIVSYFGYLIGLKKTPI